MGEPKTRPYQIRDLAGQRFDRLLATSIAGRDKWGFALWNCVCDCGSERVIRSSTLTSRKRISCGCLSRELTILRQKGVAVTHGMSDTPEHRSFCAARKRCRALPGSRLYGYYGGRGIKFLFESFEEFYEHIGPMPENGLTLDRIDNDGNYEMGNVRWATRAEQSQNTRRSRKNSG